jgi:acetyl esterase/lipase
VRGGADMGQDWYEDGRLMHKRNTFNDFVDVTRFLVKEGYADPKRVFASGRSAGGLLVGAVANQAPQDYRAIVTQVPFVDAVTTMLDESIPLPANTGKRLRTYNLLRRLAGRFEIHLLVHRNDWVPDLGAELARAGLTVHVAESEVVEKRGVRFAIGLCGSLLGRWPYSVYSHYTAGYRAALDRLLAETAPRHSG